MVIINDNLKEIIHKSISISPIVNIQTGNVAVKDRCVAFCRCLRRINNNFVGNGTVNSSHYYYYLLDFHLKMLSLNSRAVRPASLRPGRRAAEKQQKFLKLGFGRLRR